MTRIRRAAIVLMSLPQDDAAAVLNRLEPKLVASVSTEIAKTDRFTSDEQQHAILSFRASYPHGLRGGSGGLEVAKALLERALGKNAQSVVEDVQQSVAALPFGFLRRVDPQHLVTLINNEHPQTIAFILSYLPTSYGAQILAGLSQDRQLAVIRRIANMGQTSPEIIDEIQSGLEASIAAVAG